MDLTEFMKRIYEMEIDLCEVRSATCIIPNLGAGSNIGRVENYEHVIEVLFENDESLSLIKERIADIQYLKHRIVVIMDDGTLYYFAETED